MDLTINTKAFPDVPQDNLKDMLGVLPYWVREYNILWSEGSDIVDFMTNRYGCGKLYKFDAVILSDGTYTSSLDDPDMPHIGKMKTRHGNVYFYEYAIVALPQQDGSHYITRMD